MLDTYLVQLSDMCAINQSRMCATCRLARIYSVCVGSLV
jgi:hypothetical protein